MRRTLAMSLLTVVAALGITGGLATSASAVCGGGNPGDPCYCPGYTIHAGKVTVGPLVTC